MASENNNLSELERLIAEEKQDKARQNEIINGRSTKEKRKKITVISAVAATSIALIVGLIIYDPFTQSIRWEADPEPTPGYAGTTGGNAAIQANDPFGWAKESGKIFPIPTKEWEEKSYLDSVQERAEKERLQKYSATNLSSIASELPSEASGYTSDDSKAKNSDGSDNYAYSYWTQEVFVNETSMMLERLLNPTYGSWKTYQYSSSMDGAYDVLSRIFGDLIDPDTLKSGSGVDSIPVFADWNRDDYGLGDQLLSYEEGNRWVGEVTDLSVTFSFNEETFQREAILVANVKYSAWTKSKETVTKDGVLTLNLGSNNEKKVASQNKIFIKSAKLEF